MKRIHMESRAGNRGRKAFPGTERKMLVERGGLAALFSMAVAAILSRSRK